MRALVLGLTLGAATGCLPEDTRPPPAEVTITVSSSELTQTNVNHAQTVDGYDIYFSRVLLNLGQVELGEDGLDATCNRYSSPDYTRLFDFKQVTAPEKLGLAFATGLCSFGFRVRYPNLDAIVDRGASTADRDLMRLPGSDAYATDAGVSVYIEGAAARGDKVWHFAWPFRKRIAYYHCKTGIDDGDLAELKSGEPTSIDIEIQAEALFRPGLDPGLLHFDPYARADADADGNITLAELATITLDDVKADGLFVEVDPPIDDVPIDDLPPGVSGAACVDDNDALVKIETLSDYVYCELVPRIARYRSTGSCVTLVGRGGGRG